MRFDTVSFNYDLMPDGLSSSSTDEEISEVAKLCYAVGVAVKMDYNPDGSGSNSYNAIRGMKNNFKYEEAESLYREVSNDDPYGTEDTYFVTRIREDLLKSFPVYMSGASSEGSGADAAGHAWLCTGYRTENLKQYYMNWGWGGTRYGNGWFNLQDNNMRIPSMGYNFRVRQAVLLGLTPPEDSNRVILGIRNVEESPPFPPTPTLLWSPSPSPFTPLMQLPTCRFMAWTAAWSRPAVWPPAAATLWCASTICLPASTSTASAALLASLS